MNLAWDHWHIEASSKCALRCPRCPRAELSESLLNQQLSLSFFQNQIGQDTIAQIKKSHSVATTVTQYTVPNF